MTTTVSAISLIANARICDQFNLRTDVYFLPQVFDAVWLNVLATFYGAIIILILQLSVGLSVRVVRAGGHGKPFDPS